ncbi:MAG: site-specific DNA-methyltransferase [Prevotella sp.]|nr:site-specific DNA-methyltransferase [Prevotella sp.]
MATRYIPYYPDTLEGQARLDNFVRTKRILYYKDNNQVVNRIKRGMPLYEVAERETVGTNDTHNLVMHGECLSTCAYLKEQGIEVDLVYIDPPFASGADYAKKIYIRRNPLVQKAIAEAEQTLDNSEMQAFEEKMYGDIWDKERYLNWMYENLMAIKSVMSDTASIYVHLDYHIGHYVKILMDEIFGEDNFRNEIVWQRFTFHSDADKFGSVHETLFYYSKTQSEYIFNKQTQPFDKKYIEQRFNQTDENGRKYGTSDCTAPAHGDTGKALYFGDRLLSPPSGAMWRFSQANINKMMEEGRIEFTAKGLPRVKRYLDEVEGKTVHTIWTDIFPVNSQADERVDYATQKPEALLERIIKASSNEGMLVADFFGGSGVTAAVAHKLGRRFIHNDVNINSIQTARDRLVAAGAEFKIMDIKDGVSLFRNPVQTNDKLLKLIPGLNPDNSLNSKFWAGSIHDSQKGQMPVYLPNLLDSSKRVMDKTEINHIIREALPDLSDDVKQVVVYYIDVEDIDELKAFINAENHQTDIDIELRDLKVVLDDIVLEDEATWTLSEVNDGLFNVWQVKMNTFHSDYLKRKIEEYNLKGEAQNAKKLADGKKSNFKRIEISDEGLECIEWLSIDCSNAAKDAPWHSDTELKIEKTGMVTLNGKKTQNLWDATIKSDKKPLRLKVRSICGDETTFVLSC